MNTNNKNQLTFLSNSFFELSNDFPHPVFKAQEQLNLYCYKDELFLNSHQLFSERLKIFQSEIRSNYLYLAVSHFDGTSYERKFDVLSILNKPEYFLDMLSMEEYNDIFSSIKKAYLFDETLKWGCVLDHLNFEWIVFGINKNLDSAYRDVFIKCADIEKLRYKDTYSAIKYNYPMGTANSEFQRLLEKNYHFL